MKIIIVHLSDIHIKENTPHLVERANKIIDGIKNTETGIVQVIFALTGDLAYSGKVEEYEMVASFLDELCKNAKSKICQAINFVMVAGNHDCLFEKNKEDARNIIIDSLRTREYKFTGSSILATCLYNQRNFFSYCFEVYCATPKTNNENLFYQFEFETYGFKVSFNCINSSWISILNENEQYGKLGFPIDLLMESIDSDFSISLLHHPLNWFSMSNSKELKRFLASNSDIVLTGHEHDPNQTGVNDYKGKKNIEFIEGGVLNNNLKTDGESSFNTIFIDVSKKTHKIYQYNFTEGIYQSQVITDWIDNNQNKIRQNRYRLNDYQDKWLADPGATIYYQYDDESLSLDEIFVYPELKDTFEEGEIIKLDDKVSAEILLKVEKKANRFFIVGSEYIGKTILLKKLYKELYKAGIIPVYLEGKEIKETSPDSFKKLIQDSISNQYNKEDFEMIKQEDNSKIYVLIDNFHQCNLSLRHKARFINSNFMEQNGHQGYPNVILCGNDYLQFEELIYKDDEFVNPLVNFKNYKILPFGIRMRYKLIEKWYRNKRRNLEEPELLQKIEYAEKLVDANLGNNFIPKYPLFILVHLHNIDIERKTELKTSSYGYYYEYLIVTSLSRKEPEFLDSYMTYLTHFAYYLFTKKAHDITENEFKYFDNMIFRETRRIAKDFNSILEFLKNVGIIEKKDHLFKIKHNFIYYYFLARYLRDTVTTEDSKVIIENLIQKLYKDENSNILIFLTHLSKDKFILETLIESSKKIFSNFQPLEINGDCDTIDSLVTTLPKLVVENEDIRKNRENHRKQLENSETFSSLPDYNTNTNDSDDNREDETEKELLNNLRLSVKVLLVLGQIGKNYHGSLTILQLHNVIREAYLLGLRTINSFIEFLETNTDAAVSIIGDRLDEVLNSKNVKIAEEKKDELAKQLVFSFCLMIVGNFIKRISFAVGTEKLNETYDEVLKEFDWNSVKLIDISIKLDHYGYLPIKDIVDANKSLKKKKLSSMLLKIFVKFYLEMHPVNIESLQKLSAELGLDMKTLRLLTHKQKKDD